MSSMENYVLKEYYQFKKQRKMCMKTIGQAGITKKQLQNIFQSGYLSEKVTTPQAVLLSQFSQQRLGNYEKIKQTGHVKRTWPGVKEQCFPYQRISEI